MTGLAALPAALPPRHRPDDTTGPLIETLARGMRAGAMKYADRALYRLTRQMVREGVLAWRDERGRVQEHPCLRTTVDDPAPLVAEREFRRELKAFVARYGPRLLGWRTWERFRLHYFEGWTQAAIAARQEVTQQAVSESLAHAACRLREAFCQQRAAATPPPARPARARSARRHRR
ncbi:MAG: sigma-70 family RNA polymerase sigma factor [Armatimonadetes bacterium]|nr:sigma-70 family RNA polymerase sigma factor [Armatimonadota bacterium]